MDSSSEGSFAWTDIPNDTVDSDSSMKDNIHKNYSEDESVSGKTYKKRLQKELFAQESPSGLAKRKRRSDHSESDEVSHRKKKIKREPESDVDASLVKNKRSSLNHSDTHEHESYDESYLNLKVKQEKKVGTLYSIERRASADKTLTESNSLMDDDVSSAQIKAVKKSKKRSKQYSEELHNLPEELQNPPEVDNPYEDEKLNHLVKQENELNEGVIKKKKKKKAKSRKDSSIDESDILDSGVNGIHSPVVNEAPLVTPHRENNKNYASIQGIRTTEMKIDATQNATPNQYYNDVKKKPRISERIQFEEECSDLESSQIKENVESSKSGKLRKFRKDNEHLNVLQSSHVKSETAFSVDDELWLLRCPKNVDVDSFQGKIVTLEGKCKLKLNGETFEGMVDNHPTTMSILNQEHSTFVIKTLLVKGSLNLRKRIPKTHIQDDSTININQNNFIPLPETKSRHPLFGYNYKKAIKLPASVTEQLNSTAPNSAHTYKKTKLKKEASTSSEYGNGTTSVKSPIEEHKFEQPMSKRKNKHKNHVDSEPAPKKHKKSKQSLDSAEAWDSEKAIEENLFNF